jgi:hypothetical protein
VTYQGTHFINDAIRYLIDHLILKHISFIVYYPQGNGQVQSINKVLGTLFTKLVNENWNDWYVHTLIFSLNYFKGWNRSHSISTCILHSLLLTKYLLPS